MTRSINWSHAHHTEYLVFNLCVNVANRFLALCIRVAFSLVRLW